MPAAREKSARTNFAKKEIPNAEIFFRSSIKRKEPFTQIAQRGGASRRRAIAQIGVGEREASSLIRARTLELPTLPILTNWLKPAISDFRI